MVMMKIQVNVHAAFFSSDSSVLQACFQIVKKAITRYLVFQDRSKPYFQIWSETDGHRGCREARHGLVGLELTSPNYVSPQTASSPFCLWATPNELKEALSPLSFLFHSTKTS